MQTTKEKIAYLRGVLDGSDSFKDPAQKGVFEKLLDIVDALASEVDDLAIEQQDLEEYVQAVDEDLYDLEDDMDDLEEDDQLEMVEMDCPSCGETVVFEEGFLYDDDIKIHCPHCDAIVFDSVDLEDEEVGDESLFRDEE